MNETKEIIDRRIAVLEKALEQLTPGSKEYTMVAASIANLLKIRAQIDANELEAATTAEQGKKDRFVRIGTEVLGVTLPLAVYALLWKQGLRFEKDGYIGSNSVKNLFQRFKFF